MYVDIKVVGTTWSPCDKC